MDRNVGRFVRRHHSSSFTSSFSKIYGTPGSSTSFDAIFNNFTSALQSLSTSPSSYSAQSAAVSAAQGVAQNLNSMTAGIQQLRSQAEAGIANDVQTANTALQQIAQINQQLVAASPDSSTATLEDQRDQDITQLSQLMNVNVVQGSNNQISVFTGTGQQLVASNQAAQLSFNGVGTLTATSQWSANPSQDGVGTITLTSPGGVTTDLVATATPFSRARSAPTCRCATASCRRRRPSSTSWQIRCRRRSRTRRRPARR